MQKIMIAALLLFCVAGKGQELYVFSEPASNMPAHSLSTKLTGIFSGKNQNDFNRFLQRYTPEVMLGLNKNWMLHAAVSFADLHSTRFRWESLYAYIKYRFLSVDDVHKHFRMAVFAEGSYTRSPFEFADLSLQGDKSGVALGLIATQLINKLAVSATVSHTQALDASRYDKVLYTPPRNYQSLSASFSAGYLLFPFNYTDYRQINLNLYIEVIGQQALDQPTNYWDLAPALQLIFNSNSKVNLGYRFQVSGTMPRMTRQNFLIGFERTFLSALKKRRN